MAGRAVSAADHAIRQSVRRFAVPTRRPAARRSLGRGRPEPDSRARRLADLAEPLPTADKAVASRDAGHGVAHLTGKL